MASTPRGGVRRRQKCDVVKFRLDKRVFEADSESLDSGSMPTSLDRRRLDERPYSTRGNAAEIRKGDPIR